MPSILSPSPKVALNLDLAQVIMLFMYLSTRGRTPSIQFSFPCFKFRLSCLCALLVPSAALPAALRPE